MRYWYFAWMGIEDSKAGVLATCSLGDRFPLIQELEKLRREMKITCAITFWAEITEAEFLDFDRFCQQSGYGNYGKPIQRLSLIENRDDS